MTDIPVARIASASWGRRLLASFCNALRVVAPTSKASLIARVYIPEYAGGGYVDVLPLGVRDDRPTPTSTPGPGVRSPR